MRRYWVKYDHKYSRLVIAKDKLEARTIARDEYDREHGNRVTTPLYCFQADYNGPA